MSIEALASYILNEVALDGDYGRFFMLLYSFFDSYTIHSGASELEKLSSYISAHYFIWILGYLFENQCREP